MHPAAGKLLQQTNVPHGFMESGLKNFASQFPLKITGAFQHQGPEVRPRQKTSADNPGGAAPTISTSTLVGLMFPIGPGQLGLFLWICHIFMNPPICARLMAGIGRKPRYRLFAGKNPLPSRSLFFAYSPSTDSWMTGGDLGGYGGTVALTLSRSQI